MAVNEKDISDLLNDLEEFKDYFIKNEKIHELVELINEKTGLNKTLAVILIKYIAPFLWKHTNNAWKKKLHERLSYFPFYFHAAQFLINLLKTRSDKRLELSFSIPARENLESLLKDDVRWESLEPEQQALIQILLGQNDIIEGQDYLLKNIKLIIDQLSFRIKLKDPADFINKKAKKGTALWLNYANRQANLVGRERELIELNNFFDQEEEFSWWFITGEGGVGKSRLALDAMHDRKNTWEIGFLAKKDITNIGILSKTWTPNHPTIISIDYASEHHNDIIFWLDFFIENRKEYYFPVRVILLERRYENEKWWKNLISNNSDGLLREMYLYKNTPCEVSPLSIKQQRLAIKNFIISLGHEACLPDEESSQFWNLINRLSKKGTPLFIGMIAIAITHQNSLEFIKNWDTRKLLDYILQREESYWEKISTNKSFFDANKKQLFDLICISTISSGIDWKSVDEDIKINFINYNIADSYDDLYEKWSLVELMTGNNQGVLEPDILAEYFVLKKWKEKENIPYSRCKKLFHLCFQINHVSTYHFIRRTIFDTLDPYTATLWKKYWDEFSMEQKHEESFAINSITKIKRLKYYIDPSEALLDDLRKDNWHEL